MFDIGSSELLLIAVVALLVIGPKDLPRVLNQVGKWIAKARAMTGHLKTGLETMAREAELEEMEKQWAAHNERIMADHPADPGMAVDQPTDGMTTGVTVPDDSEVRRPRAAMVAGDDAAGQPIADPAPVEGERMTSEISDPAPQPPTAA